MSVRHCYPIRVSLRVEERWVPALLMAWEETDDEIDAAFVEYRDETGRRFAAWVPASRLRHAPPEIY